VRIECKGSQECCVFKYNLFVGFIELKMIKVANIIQSLYYQYFICKFVNHELNPNIDQLCVSKMYFKNGIASNFEYIWLN
jgi:hypothetical protein